MIKMKINRIMEIKTTIFFHPSKSITIKILDLMIKMLTIPLNNLNQWLARQEWALRTQNSKMF